MHLGVGADTLTCCHAIFRQAVKPSVTNVHAIFCFKFKVDNLDFPWRLASGWGSSSSLLELKLRHLPKLSCHPKLNCQASCLRTIMHLGVEADTLTCCHAIFRQAIKPSVTNVHTIFFQLKVDNLDLPWRLASGMGSSSSLLQLKLRHLPKLSCHPKLNCQASCFRTIMHFAVEADTLPCCHASCETNYQAIWYKLSCYRLLRLMLIACCCL